MAAPVSTFPLENQNKVVPIVTPIPTTAPVKETKVDSVIYQVITELLKETPENSTPLDKAKFLSHKIDCIGRRILQEGVSLAHYVPKRTPYGEFFFASTAIWEGISLGIPLTFLIYAWPVESYALSINSRNRWHKSNIHRHPISCALTVLKGSLEEENYKPVSGYSFNAAKLECVKNLSPGCLNVDDDPQKNFIHRIISRDKDNQITWSLHAYGLASAQEVMSCFDRTFDDCQYTSVP